jgi:hypothetical protein
MSSEKQQASSLLTNGTSRSISIVVLIVAVGLLIYQLFSGILVALNQSPVFGLRSAAAGLLPIIIVGYLAYLAKLRIPGQASQASIINNFVLFLLWTVFLLGLDNTIETLRFPIEELLYSFTIAAIIWRYKRQESFKALLACCYGVLAGAVAALMIFGFNPVTV